MEFEDVIEKAGGYGKFQKILVWVYLAPASFFMPGCFMNQIFMLSVPQHSCLLPDLGEVFNLTGGDLELLHDLLVSKDNCEVYPLSAFNASAVQMYLDHAGDENWTRLQVPGLERIPCAQFTYDKTNYESTASTQWNLVCDRAHLPSLVFTLCSVSCAVGTVLLGMLSDRIGRRYMFFITVVVAVLSGLSSILVTNFTAFATLRALNASVMPQMFQLPYIILLELVGPKQRTMMLGVSCIAWTVGLCILPLLAYVCRSWILLGLICSACAIPSMFYIKLIPESPRWLLSQGRVQETLKILERIAKRNGVKLPEDLESDLLALVDGYEANKVAVDAKGDSPHGARAKQRAWDRITASLFAVSGIRRDVAEIKKKWSDHKSANKIRGAAARRSQNATGGGPGEPPLTGAEERVISLLHEDVVLGIDGGFDIGVQQLDVSASPRTSQVISPTVISPAVFVIDADAGPSSAPDMGDMTLARHSETPRETNCSSKGNGCSGSSCPNRQSPERGEWPWDSPKRSAK
ncbi:carcinine transporter [Ixodes scapularis]